MAAIRIFRRLAELLDVSVSSPTDGQVLTYDTGTSKWRNEAAGNSGSSSDVKLASATLTSAQILDLANTPVEIVPAPGAGKANVVTFVAGAYHFGTVQYTGSGTIGVAPAYRGARFDADEARLVLLAFSAIVTFDASAFYTGAAVQYDHTDLVNQAWSVKVDNEVTPLADGDGTLTIYCSYFTVDA